MTPVVLALNLGLSYMALAALCLSMKRHHSAVFRAHAELRRTLILRVAGWIGVGLSLVLAVIFEGWTFGPVQWIGSLTASALLVIGVLSYRPAYILPSTMLVVPLTVLAAVSI